MKIVSPGTCLIGQTLPDPQPINNKLKSSFSVETVRHASFPCQIPLQIKHKRHAFSPAKVLKKQMTPGWKCGYLKPVSFHDGHLFLTSHCSNVAKVTNMEWLEISVIVFDCRHIHLVARFRRWPFNALFILYAEIFSYFPNRLSFLHQNQRSPGMLHTHPSRNHKLFFQIFHRTNNRQPFSNAYQLLKLIHKVDIR